MPHATEYAQTSTRSWTTRHSEKKRRVQLVSSWLRGPLLPREKLARLLVAVYRGAGEPPHFDVPHRRLTKEALVFAVELTRTLIADALAASSPSASIRSRAATNRSCFWY